MSEAVPENIHHNAEKTASEAHQALDWSLERI